MNCNCRTNTCAVCVCYYCPSVTGDSCCSYSCSCHTVCGRSCYCYGNHYVGISASCGT